MDRQSGLPPRSGHYPPGGLSRPESDQDNRPAGSDSEIASGSYGMRGMRQVSIAPSSPGLLQAADDGGAAGGVPRRQNLFSSGELDLLDSVRPVTASDWGMGLNEQAQAFSRNVFWSHVDSTPMTLEELQDCKADMPSGTSRGRKNTLNDRIEAMRSQPEGAREQLTPAQRYIRSQNPSARMDMSAARGEEEVMSAYYAQPENVGYGHSHPVLAEAQVMQGRSRDDVVKEQRQIAEQAYLRGKQAEEEAEKSGKEPVQQLHFCRTCGPDKRLTKESFEKKLFMRLPCTHYFYCENHMGEVNGPCDFVSEGGLICDRKIESLLKIRR